ncbi:MAG: glycosyltransferase family 1 protein [Planctomycetota bacterium]
MKVAIGALLGPLGGVSEYGRQLIRALDRIEGPHRFYVITDEPEQLRGVSGSVEVIALPFRGGLDRLRWQHWALPRLVKRLRPDLYHDTKNALPWRLPVPSVVTIHDLAMYRCPETFTFSARQFLQRHTEHAVRRARRIIAVSRSTRHDLEDLFDVGHKTDVVYNGISPEFFEAPVPAAEATVLEKHGIAFGSYVLSVGTLQPRKRVAELLSAVLQLRASGHSDLRLVIVGRAGWKSEALQRQIAAHPEAVTWLGPVPGDELPALYRGAAVFASPSSYEGFGLTVAEAMAAGAPVLTTRVSSLPEVGGKCVRYVDEPTTSQLTTALGEMLAMDGLRRELANEAKARAERFRWERAAAETVAVYETAVWGAAASAKTGETRGLERFSHHWHGRQKKSGRVM